MKLQPNAFKLALQKGESQLGIWLGLCNPVSAEICAGIGYDWCLIDCEHAPNSTESTLAQLQAMAPYPIEPVVRPAWNDPVEIKRLLDIGARNFLVPMVQSAAEARAAVAAVRYPPQGIRGVGTGLARAAHWGAITDYLASANDNISVLCQVETVEALAQLDEILAVEGVDGVFIGPADLAASMGHLCNPGHPDVRKTVEDTIVRIRKAGKAPGILQTAALNAPRALELGAQFVAVGIDTLLLRRAATELLRSFKPEEENLQANSFSY